MDSRIEKLADMMVNYSCKVKPGEHVMVTYSGAETLDMVTAVIEKIYAAGGSPFCDIRGSGGRTHGFLPG